MKVEQGIRLESENQREEQILHDVVGTMYPYNYSYIGAPAWDGVTYRPPGYYRATPEQVAKIMAELQKSDEQRREEWALANPNLASAKALIAELEAQRKRTNVGSDGLSDEDRQDMARDLAEWSDSQEAKQ